MSFLIILCHVTGTAGYSGDGGPASSARIRYPRGVAVYSNSLYIADASNNVIRKVDLSTKIITTIAGSGSSGFSGDGGPAINAQLNSPYFIIFDSLGNLFISDTLNNRVRVVEPSTGHISTYAGNGTNTVNFTGSGLLATDAGIGEPTGLSFDSDNNLYIVSKPSVILMVAQSTNLVTNFVGNGTFLGASTPATGYNGPATSATLCSPYGLAFDRLGNLYLTQGSTVAMVVSAVAVFPSPPPLLPDHPSPP